MHFYFLRSGVGRVELERVGEEEGAIRHRATLSRPPALSHKEEGIKDFRLDFFDSSNVLIPGVSFSNTAAVGQTDLQEFYFSEVEGVSRVDLVVLNTHTGTFNRIEIREVELTGISVTVSEPTSIFGTGFV